VTDGPYTAEELATGEFERNAVTHRERAPYKVGICLDFAGGTQLARDFYDGIQLAIDEAVERGDVDHPVELVVREVEGPMRGTSPAVVSAWRELAHEEDCLVILGPVVTEANLAIVDEVNASRVPTISFCASFDWAGPYCYALQNGGFPDEANVLAAHMAHEALQKVAVFHEDGLIGEEFLRAFKAATRRHGLQIVGEHTVGLFNTLRPVEPQLAASRAAGAEAIVVLSAYGALAPVQRALAAVEDTWGWHPARYQNMTWVAMTALGTIGDYDLDALLASNEGWIGLDQIHEGNAHFQAVLDRFEDRHHRRPFHSYTALGFDHGLVVSDALSRMKPPSREGFKDALERLRMRPSCIGSPGTVISFAPHDNRGYRATTSSCARSRTGSNAGSTSPWSTCCGSRHRPSSPRSSTTTLSWARDPDTPSSVIAPRSRSVCCRTGPSGPGCLSGTTGCAWPSTRRSRADSSTARSNSSSKRSKVPLSGTQPA
jgi:ABC-type branched-subunit amino acid transport system substrate-binding protein